MQKKSKNKWPWLILVGILIVGGGFLANQFITARSLRAKAITYNTHVIGTGSVEVNVTGSGMVVPTQTESIDIPEGITIDEVLVQAGDLVDSGQILATFDLNSLQDKAAALSDELATLDKQLEKLNDAKTVQYVYAPMAGRIKYLPVEVDDEVTGSIAKNGALAILSTDGQMRVDIQTVTELELHSKVTVKSGKVEKNGEVVAQTPTGYTITMSDYETPYGQTAKVYQGELLIGKGVLEINRPVAVYANGGRIAKIYHAEEIRVTADSKLFQLNNEPLTNSYQQTYSKRGDKAGELQMVLAYLENPVITADTKGTISEVLVAAENGSNTLAQATNSASSVGNSSKPNAGTTANSSTATTSSQAQTPPAGTNGTTKAFEINRAGALQMTIAVDELDIGSMALGQTAKLALDAIDRETFAAKVTRISYLGQAKGNITTYNVELTLEADPRFLTGMNGNATITAKKVDDVLLVPIEAMNEDETGIYVYVSPGALTDGQDRQRRTITTGLSDGEYAEVKSGLSKGDVVLYPKPEVIVPAQSGFPGRPGGGISGSFNQEGSTGGTQSGN